MDETAGQPTIVRLSLCTEDAETLRLTMVERPDGTGRRIELSYWPDFDEHQVHWDGHTSRREPTRSWTLIGSELSLEFSQRSAQEMGIEELQRIVLDVDEVVLARTCDRLLEILSGGTCFIVDCLGLRRRD